MGAIFYSITDSSDELAGALRLSWAQPSLIPSPSPYGRWFSSFLISSNWRQKILRNLLHATNPGNGKEKYDPRWLPSRNIMSYIILQRTNFNMVILCLDALSSTLAFLPWLRKSIESSSYALQHCLLVMLLLSPGSEDEGLTTIWAKLLVSKHTYLYMNLCRESYTYIIT